jgi:phage gp36-like protein
MLKERRAAVEQVAQALWDAEAAIDAALSKTATLTGAIPQVSKSAKLCTEVGQNAMERATQTIMALTEARRAIVEMHKELTVAKHQIGMGAMMQDAGSGKPLAQAPADPVQVRPMRPLRVA